MENIVQMPTELSEEEESKITMIAYVQKCLEDMNPEAEKSEESKIGAVAHLLTAIRYYCDFHDLSFRGCNSIAKHWYTTLGVRKAESE
jgi:hypothetical protein